MSTVEDQEPGVSGKWVVMGMFLFAILCTTALWTYSRLHNAPFIPLRRALATEIGRDYQPRVEGGRHKGGPMTLRVVLLVDFDPTATDAETVERVRRLDEQIIALARQHQRLEDYEIFEINLVHPVPEGEAQRRERVMHMRELIGAGE